MDEWMWENFPPNEIVCKCLDDCVMKDATMMDTGVLDDIQIIRQILNRPVVITSALRCAEYNKAIGGKPDSAHVKGLALDIYCPTSRERFELYDRLRPLFNRIGIGKDFIHVDADESKSQNVMWVY
jgi:uncharacterized protein YcbK (DUF882 family)